MNTNLDDSGLPRNRLWQPVTAKWFAAVFGVCLAYAVVRYHVVGTVAWAHFPLFILNKIVSWAAVVFIACSYLVGRVFKWHNHDKPIRLVVVKFCGLMGFVLAGVHAFMSFCLLRPSYFAKYFAEDGRLNLEGEMGMATGILALWFLASPAVTTLPMMASELGGKRWKRAQRLGYVALLLTVVHLVFLGLRGWMSPHCRRSVCWQ
jgi:DMSO/TMAO reductase YedYZ heme-binding membrane subunit